ncbi:MAG: transcriptional regulator [Thermoguttaceae bacterium]
MSDQANVLKTTLDDVPREVLDLAEAIHALPAEHRQAIEPFLTRVIDSNRRRRRILVLVQDALSQLRLDMKYLTFDLEATRRERDELRRKSDGTT